VITIVFVCGFFCPSWWLDGRQYAWAFGFGWFVLALVLSPLLSYFIATGEEGVEHIRGNGPTAY
jgi:hypothetical protein